MKIGGYTINRKHKVLSVDKKIYPGDRKRFSVMFYEYDETRERPIWKEFDNRQDAVDYITAIEKLITKEV